MLKHFNSVLLFITSFSAVMMVLLFTPLGHAEEFEAIFNGKDLAGWTGNPKVWSVQDGAIRGATTADSPIEHNTFLVWQGGKVGDFELRLKYRITGGNSGIQYRSRVIDPKEWIVGGYQADIDSGPTYSGILYDERGRGILAKRGERMVIASDGTRQVESFGDAAELQKKIHPTDWNDYLIEAHGNALRHTINGQLMSETVDADKEKSVASGVLALQVHAGDPMTIEFRDVRLKRLDK